MENGNKFYLYDKVLAQQENEAEANTDIKEQKNTCKNESTCENSVSINVSSDKKIINTKQIPTRYTSNPPTTEFDPPTIDVNVDVNNNQNFTNTSNILQNNTQIVKQENKIPVTKPSSITVKKEIFGCNYFPIQEMVCGNLKNDSQEWLSCNDPSINFTIECGELHENFFDIRVLNEQNILVRQFEGSSNGTYIGGIKSGGYTIEEIKYDANIENQLEENLQAYQSCKEAGFLDGGGMTVNSHLYQICIQYMDEYGNNCSHVDLSTEENKICTVGNYIFQVFY